MCNCELNKFAWEKKTTEKPNQKKKREEKTTDVYEQSIEKMARRGETN